MAGYASDIEKKSRQNSFFREVLFTGSYCQLVVMSLGPGEAIGSEVHPSMDQFFRFESGNGKVVIDGQETTVADGWAVVVPAGSEHNVINTGAAPLKLYTIYSPPKHPDGTNHKTLAEAQAAEDKGHH